MSQTTSPMRSSASTPARLSSASHSSTLLSDNQSPSGEGTNTRSSGARFTRNSGERNAVPGAVECGCECPDVGDGARLDVRDGLDRLDAYPLLVSRFFAADGGLAALAAAVSLASRSACALRRKTTRVYARADIVRFRAPARCVGSRAAGGRLNDCTYPSATREYSCVGRPTPRM
jgi:hypothetical protein